MVIAKLNELLCAARAICSGPTADPGHPWIAWCSWMAWVRSWPRTHSCQEEGVDRCLIVCVRNNVRNDEATPNLAHHLSSRFLIRLEVHYLQAWLKYTIALGVAYRGGLSWVVEPHHHCIMGWQTLFSSKQTHSQGRTDWCWFEAAGTHSLYSLLYIICSTKQNNHRDAIKETNTKEPPLRRNRVRS